jgi:hypothetical protein
MNSPSHGTSTTFEALLPFFEFAPWFFAPADTAANPFSISCATSWLWCLIVPL